MQTRRALLQRHAPGPVPDNIPHSLQQLLRQCFHETPDQRPSLLQIRQVGTVTQLVLGYLYLCIDAQVKLQRIGAAA